MDSRSALGIDAFEKFASAKTCEVILDHFSTLCQILEIEPTNCTDFFRVLKETLTSSDLRDLFAKFDRRLSFKPYSHGRACTNSNVLVIGAGPCGLRFAIEAQLLGARVVVIEKRSGFTRNNVLHLWPFVLSDLRDLGVKRFCPKFCPGSIDHVSIAQLQCILLKIALTLGVQVFTEIEFLHLVEPEVKVKNTGSSEEVTHGWRAATTATEDHPINSFEFDVVIGADGRQNVLPGFRRKELRAKLAIAITVNFVNRRSAAEVKVQEISGVSSIFRQALFHNLAEETGIDLENIVYYKDDTHYFVMTAKKQSLLWKGVLKENYADTDDLLAPENVDMEALEAYTLEAVRYVTEDGLPNLELTLNNQGKPDLAIFDFTKMYAAENSCRVLERNGCRLLLGLVGDSLLEPFWPTGSGCARGFLSALDAAWMIRSWAREEDVLDVLAERETIYRLLAQTTHDNLNKDYKSYTVDPTTRYPNLVTGTVQPCQINFLYDTGFMMDTDTNFTRQESPRVPCKISPTTPKYGERSLTCLPVKAPQQVKRSPSPRTQPRNTNGSTCKTVQQDLAGERQWLNIDFLVDWLRVTLDPYGIQVSGIHDIFVRGDVLCGLIHVFRPDLIPQYPFSPEIEEGIEVSDLAAFRNQIAFDFLNDEYDLPYIVSGYDSVQYTITHLQDLVHYLFQVYSIFSNSSEIPVPAAPQQPARKLTRSATFSSTDSNRQFGEYSRPNRTGHCIRNLQQRFQGLSFQPTESRDQRTVRRQDAERCKLKAMDFMSSIQERKIAAEKEAIEARRERVVKTIKAVHVTVPESKAIQSASTSTKENDDFFNEYNMRLWRQSVPTMEERMGKLENAFAAPLPSSKSKTPLKRAKSCATVTPKIIAAAKVNKNDWVQQVIAQKFPDAPLPPITKTTSEVTDFAVDEGEPASFSLLDQENTGTDSSVLGSDSPEKFYDTVGYEHDASNVLFEDSLNDNAEDEIILDRVPERVFYCAQTEKIIEPQTEFENDKKKIPNPGIEFDEKDEDLLELLDSSDLEHLEAWAGKYL